MNNTLIKVCLIWIATMVLSSALVFGQSAPKFVDVGLLFRIVNSKPIQLESEMGFDVVLSQTATQYDLLLNLHNYKALSIYKMGEYVYNAENAVLSPRTEAGKGAFVLKIGESQTNIQAINEQLAQLKQKDLKFVLGLSNDYTIYYGSYDTQALAIQDLSRVAATGITEPITVVKLPETYVGIYSNEEPLTYLDTNQPLALSAELIKYNGIQYRNQMLFRRFKGSDVTLINRVTLPHYLYGVVPKEVVASWPMDALKAQAIAAKNFFFTQQNNYKHLGFNVTNTTLSQVYGGFTSEHPRTNQAVDETIDEALYYGNDFVECFYNAHSGGYTELASNVWSKDLPYLQSFLDPYGSGAPNDYWKTVLGKSEIESRLLKAGHEIGALQKIELLNRTQAGRILEIAFVGTQKTAVFTRQNLRTILPSTELKSTLFQLEPYGEAEKTVSHGQPQVDTAPEKPFNPMLKPTPTLSPQGMYMEKVSENVYGFSENGTAIYVEVGPSQKLGAASYDVSQLGDIVFYGRGYGHGVGMSQWGARKMADAGMTYKEILNFYYKNTELRKLP